jgi:hypothetical protein
VIATRAPLHTRLINVINVTEELLGSISFSFAFGYLLEKKARTIIKEK